MKLLRLFSGICQLCSQSVIRFFQLLPSCQSSLVEKQLRKQKESKLSVKLPTEDLLMYLIALEVQKDF